VSSIIGPKNFLFYFWISKNFKKSIDNIFKWFYSGVHENATQKKKGSAAKTDSDEECCLCEVADQNVPST
jgi:hypothetical protein